MGFFISLRRDEKPIAIGFMPSLLVLKRSTKDPDNNWDFFSTFQDKNPFCPPVLFSESLNPLINKYSIPIVIFIRITAIINMRIYSILKLFYFPKYDKKDLIFYIIILLSMIRPLGFVLRSPIIDGIGVATCISPLPTVFSSPGGIEAFTSKFLIVHSANNSQSDTTLLTPAHFGKLHYPHPVRNAIGLSFAYFPLLPDSVANSVLHYLFYKEMVLKTMDFPYSDSYILINRNEGNEATRSWSIQIRSDEEQY